MGSRHSRYEAPGGLAAGAGSAYKTKSGTPGGGKRGQRVTRDAWYRMETLGQGTIRASQVKSSPPEHGEFHVPRPRLACPFSHFCVSLDFNTSSYIAIGAIVNRTVR